MEDHFNPNSEIIRLCMQASIFNDNGQKDEAKKLIEDGMSQATTDMEIYLLTYFMSKIMTEASEKIEHLMKALKYAQKASTPSAESAYGTLYKELAQWYKTIGEIEKAAFYEEKATEYIYSKDQGPFYHGTRADLKVGDLLLPGGTSNYQANLKMNHIYFTALINGAGLAAALANGDSEERVYIVKPLGQFENDPNVTDKKFPGNPTRSYRSSEPLEIIGEIQDWDKITPEQLKAWRERLAKNTGEIIN